MRHDELVGAVVFIDAEVYTAIAVAADATVTFRKVGTDACPTCGAFPDRHYVIGARNYQAEVRPVPTIAFNGSTANA